MTFVAIALLSALPLALAPILLHFFDRRRKVVIHWGAMQFLQEAAARRTSARKLQQWLLLLLRTLAIAILIFAISGPFLPVRWTASAQRQQWIFIIDNSLSTGLSDPSLTDASAPNSTLDQILAEVQQRIDDRPAADSVRLLAASPHPTWLNVGSARLTPVDRDQLSSELQRLKPTAASSDLLSGLLAAIQTEGDDQFQSRRVVLFTDGQAADWRTRDQTGWSRFRRALASADMPTKVEVVEMPARPDLLHNVAVTRVESSRTALGPNQTMTLRSLTKNLSNTPAPATIGRWLVGDQQIHEETVPELPPGGVHESLWRHAFDTPNTYVVRYQVDSNDPLVGDDSNSVVVDVRNAIPVLVVDGSNSLSNVRQDAYYINAALGRIEGEATRWQSVFSPTTITPQQLETVSLDEYMAVIVPNLGELSRPTVDRLERHVSAGGALWIAAGPRTDIRAFNERLYRDGGGLAPLPIETLQDYFDTTKPTIDAALNSHLANARLKDDQRLDLGDVRVDRSYRFGSSDEQRDLTTSLLSLSNGEPLAVEKTFGKGRVLMMAAPLQSQWSDLILSQSFVVMLEDYLAYLTAPSTPQHNLQAGEPLVCPVGNQDDLTASATLVDPQGNSWQVTPELTESGAQFRTTRTQLPGRYSLDFSLATDDMEPSRSLAFYVQRPPAESKLTLLDESAKDVLATVGGIVGNQSQSKQFGKSQRQPLWPLLFAVVLLTVVAELMLSGVIARSRVTPTRTNRPADTQRPRAVADPKSVLDDGSRTTMSDSIPSSSPLSVRNTSTSSPNHRTEVAQK